MDDVEFLTWLRHRLVNVYDESPNVDFVKRLEEIIEKQMLIRENTEQYLKFIDKGK